ncbi:hypothetical protein JOB18_002212 [Solea senegalensis]|uniref:Uncharacterized protein n=1 Tax=Solea senegalensis TaxID=28829 RepID=A0AAV6SND3_SOLSE|nr:hypothetical protein JOB18_002212 [Solea senegalensis]
MSPRLCLVCVASVSRLCRVVHPHTIIWQLSRPPKCCDLFGVCDGDLSHTVTARVSNYNTGAQQHANIIDLSSFADQTRLRCLSPRLIIAANTSRLGGRETGASNIVRVPIQNPTQHDLYLPPKTVLGCIEEIIGIKPDEIQRLNSDELRLELELFEHVYVKSGVNIITFLDNFGLFSNTLTLWLLDVTLPDLQLPERQ